MLAWLTRFIEHHSGFHRLSVKIWRSFPPRLAGFLKSVLTRSWVVGVVAVMLDESVSPPEIFLGKHSYRPRGAWGLPGGSLESVPGNPKVPHEASPDDAIEAALRKEMQEELGIEIQVHGLWRADAIPYVAEEPGPYRLTFYFNCEPDCGFSEFRSGLSSGEIVPRSPEIQEMRFVSLDEVSEYDLFSTDSRFLLQDLPRLRQAAGSLYSTASAGSDPA